MPHLGLGLEITSDNRSLATKLANNSTMLIDPNRALNNGAGVNSPFTNPLNSLAATEGHLEGNGALYVNTQVTIPTQFLHYKLKFRFDKLPSASTGSFQRFTGAKDTDHGIFIRSSGVIEIKMPTTVGDVRPVVNESNINVGLQNEIEFKYDGANLTLVVNGVSDVKSITGDMLANGKILTIGSPSGTSFSDSGVVLGFEQYDSFGNTIYTTDYSNQTPLGLVNFAETTADGYEVIVAPNGRQVTAEHSDGIDSYGVFPNVEGLDPTGSESFAYGTVIKTSNVLQLGYLIAKSLDSNFANIQYGIYINPDTNLYGVIGGSFYQLGTAVFSTNAFYKIILKRNNGRLIVKINNVETYNQINSDNLVSQPNVRTCAISGDASGTTHANYYKGHTLVRSFALTNLDRWEQDFNNYCLTEFGL